MTLRNCIEYVDSIKPNAFSNDVKTGWLNQCEGLVQSEVFLLHPAEIITYDWKHCAEHELLLDPPHDKIYPAYLISMIDRGNGEDDKYYNSAAIYNEYWRELVSWFALRYRPADRQERVYINETKGMYI